MTKYIFLTSFLVYLISCTSNDTGMIRQNRVLVPLPVKTSLGHVKSKTVQIKEFDTFLSKLSTTQMVYAAEKDIHQEVKNYLPDSTIAEGFDLHLHEIGRIDTFRFVFHEYFDLYDDWSKTYLNIFSPSGQALNTIRLWDLSFEGNSTINFINNEIMEIAYRDFFETSDDRIKSIVPEENIYLNTSSKVKDQVEGTIYQYYKITSSGNLEDISQNLKVSIGRKFPQSSAKLLSKAEMEQFSLKEIKLMKNEILAEHGYRFPELKTLDYFEKQDWYFPTFEKVDHLMTDIEHMNFKTLSEIEKEY